MRKIKATISNEVHVKNIAGYFEKTITKFGTGAKIDAPKEHLGKKVIIIVCNEEDSRQKPRKKASQPLMPSSV